MIISKARTQLSSWLLAVPLLSLTLTDRADIPHADYALNVHIDLATHALEVRTDIELPESYAGQTLEFLLTDTVETITPDPVVKPPPKDNSKGFTGINGSCVDMNDNEHAARYEVQLPPGGATLHLTYRGTINFALGEEKEQYTCGFHSIIGDEGIYLAGSSLWYPLFGNNLVSFKMSVNAPEGWHLISQGWLAPATSCSTPISAGLAQRIFGA